MATAYGASGTPTPGRSARAGRKRDGIPWHSPLTQVVKGALYRIFGRLELPAGYRYTTVCTALIVRKRCSKLHGKDMRRNVPVFVSQMLRYAKFYGPGSEKLFDDQHWPP